MRSKSGISSTLARFGLEILEFALGGASGALTEGRALLSGAIAGRVRILVPARQISC